VVAVLTADLQANLSAVLLARCDALALPVPGLLRLAGALPRGNSLTIDFRPVEQLGHPIVVLSITSALPAARFDVLTPRELEVATCVASGLPNREIAARLWLTTATVKDHVHRILVKTGLPNRTALASAWNRESIQSVM
jgi:DNA-binding CsgD family transcriptional regulator